MGVCVCACVCVGVSVSVCMGLLGDRVAVLASLCDRINCLSPSGCTCSNLPRGKGYCPQILKLLVPADLA